MLLKPLAEVHAGRLSVPLQTLTTTLYILLNDAYIQMLHCIVIRCAACKSNIKANKNVTAHLNHVKNTRDTHILRHSRVGG